MRRPTGFSLAARLVAATLFALEVVALFHSSVVNATTTTSFEKKLRLLGGKRRKKERKKRIERESARGSERERAQKPKPLSNGSGNGTCETV